MIPEGQSGMTFEQQIQSILDAAARELSAGLEGQFRALSEELGTAIAADRLTSGHEMEAAAAETTRRVEQAVAAAQAESTRQVEAAVEAARVEGNRRTEVAIAALNADFERRVEEDVAARAASALESQAERTLQQLRVEAMAAERQVELQQLERLLDGIRRLDGAGSLSDVLNQVADSASGEAPRVAVFLVLGDRLQGWRLAGFDSGEDARAMGLAVGQSGIVAQAIRAGRSCSTPEPGGAAVASPFGPLPDDCAGVAVPIRVGGETVAVVYADNAGPGEKEVPSAWPEAIELLARHAARCLEVVTVATVSRPSPAGDGGSSAPGQAAPSPAFHAIGEEDDDAARRYARLLVSEIIMYNEAAVAQGRRDHNLRERLKSEIDRARTLYEERVPAAVRARADHFGQELVRTLASGDASLLGAP